MICHHTPPRYRAYLLRFWQERSRASDGPVVWRFSLEDTRSGERYGYASLEALLITPIAPFAP